VVEDEARIASFLVKGLGAAGYAVEHVLTGGEALVRARRGEFDLIVLDLGLPDLDGTEVLEQLRASGSRVPVIVLTARGEVSDRVHALDLGADDYIVKPFSFAEFLARIRARTRPQDAPGEAGELCGGDLRLDLRSRRATVGERTFDLTGREFVLLEAFLRHPGQVLSREQLLSQVWGYHFDPGSNVVDVYVRYLRQKLGDGFIHTVRGIGYRFEPALP